MQQKIVITGAPGTGKTSIIKKLEENHFFCYHEVIRNFTLEAKENSDLNNFNSNPLTFVKDPLAFNTKILNGRIDQFNASKENEELLVFFDRAIPDILAYMDFFKQEHTLKFINACKEHQYTKVFILPPWQEIYVSDNERLESFEEAQQLHHHLESTYKKYSYETKIVPFGTVEERVSFVLNSINNE